MFRLVFLVNAVSALSSSSRDCTAWFKAQGGVAEAVVAREVEYGWGLVTTREVRKDETLLETPRELCLAAEDGPEFLRRTAGQEGMPSVSGGAVVASRLLMAQKDEKFREYLDSLPEVSVPVVWPDAAELLYGTQTLASRKELLDEWRQDFHAILKRGGGDVFSEDEDQWESWLKASALVMSRSYNAEPLGYAMIPFLDYVNHDDTPSARVSTDGRSASLVATRDIPKDTQIFASYSGFERLDGLKMLQAFGWLPNEIDTCNVDFVEALSKDDPLAPAKFELLNAIGSRAIFTVDRRLSKEVNDAHLETTIHDIALPALRLIALQDQLAFKNILSNVPDSAWFKGQSIGNDHTAISTGIDLLHRKINSLDAGHNRRQAARSKCTDPLVASLADQTATSERAALVVLRDALTTLQQR